MSTVSRLGWFDEICLKSSLLPFEAVVTNFCNVEDSMVGKVDATCCSEVEGRKPNAVMGMSHFAVGDITTLVL
jgi:hypothetical protein